MIGNHKINDRLFALRIGKLYSITITVAVEAKY